MSGGENALFWGLVILVQLPLLAITVAAAVGFVGLVQEDNRRSKRTLRG